MLRRWFQVTSFRSLSRMFVVSSSSLGQDKPLKKIYWGVSTLSPTLWIPWISKEAKIFEKNGLDVEPVLLRGSGQTSQAMLSGSLFAASVALPQVMLAVLNGADLVERRPWHRRAGQPADGETGDPQSRRSERARKSAFQAWARRAICSSVTCCASTASTRAAISIGSRSATPPSACKRFITVQWMPPIFPIPPTSRRNAKAFARCSMRKKRSSIRRRQW